MKKGDNAGDDKCGLGEHGWRNHSYNSKGELVIYCRYCNEFRIKMKSEGSKCGKIDQSAPCDRKPPQSCSLNER